LIKNNKKIFLEKVLKELFENYQYDKDYEFDEYFKYGVNFIIKLLTYYKYNIPFSKKEFKLLLIKEKEDKSNSIVNFNIVNEFFYYDELDDCYSEDNRDCDSEDDESDFEDTIRNLNNDAFTQKKEINETLTSPLHIACYYNYIEIIKLLIQYGVNLNKKNNYGDTALHVLCFCNGNEN